MFRMLDPNFKAISKDCFEKESNKLFQKMVTSVSALIKTSIDDYKGKMASLSIVHDMWTTMNNEAALGGSIKFTTKEMDTYTIAALLDKNNASHKAEHVADRLVAIFKERYGIDVKAEVSNVATVILQRVPLMLLITWERIKIIATCIFSL